MRILKLVAPFVFLIQIFAWIRPADSVASAQSKVILPASIITNFGTTDGSVAALGLLDQASNDDDPAKYVRASATSVPYYGEMVFNLSNDIQGSQITSALLQINFKGPSPAQQTWSWLIRDQTTGHWHTIGDSVGTHAGQWNKLLFPITSISRYVSTQGQVQVRLVSDTTNNSAKIDYEALHLTYFPVLPTATRPTSTTMVTKPAYVYPITYTPTLTFTPTNTPTPTRTPTSTPTPTCAAHDNAFECQVLFLINKERTDRGIAELISNVLLHNAARAHSTDMAQNNYFSHTGLDGSSPGDRIAEAGYVFSTWGENIAAGYNTPASVVAGWMKSSGHRSAILNPVYVHIGIGYAFDSSSTYDHYWTTDFGAPP